MFYLPEQKIIQDLLRLSVVFLIDKRLSNRTIVATKLTL